MEKPGFPKFKSKKNGLGSFRLYECIHVYEKIIKLPRLGLVRLKESSYLPMEDVKIISATVSEKTGRWFVSLLVEQEIMDPVPDPDKPVVGVDLGITNLVVLSDGTVYPNPKAYRRHYRKLIHLHRAVSRKSKGSKNQKKAICALAKIYKRVADIRNNTLHQITTHLAKTKSVIGIEDLRVRGMLRNHHLAGAIADVGMAEFRRQLEYKTKWYGSRLVVAPRFYSSSKTCNVCGSMNENLKLADREWLCFVCGTIHDRDTNAAINLRDVAARWADTQNACGEAISPALPADLSESGTEHHELTGYVSDNG